MITYTVTADAESLSGWTAETLAAELRSPLAELGIEVIYVPRQHGGGGLPLDADNDLRDLIRDVVERIIEAGPTPH